MSKALDYILLSQAMDEKIKPQAVVLLSKLRSLNTYIQVGQKETAFKTIDMIKMQIKPPLDKFVPLGYLNIYVELEDADKAEEAIKGVERCIQTFQIEILRPIVVYAQGKIHEFRNEYDQAILSYQKQLELEPTNTRIYRNMGRCYRNLHDFKKAEEFIQRNLNIEPYNPESNYEMALVYHEMERKQKALEHLKKALFVWEGADPEFKPAIKAREKLAEWDTVVLKT